MKNLFIFLPFSRAKSLFEVLEKKYYLRRKKVMSPKATPQAE
jgi:hypothetical protein